MKGVINRVQAGHLFELREVDISGDPELERRYGTDVPVLELDGRKIAKYRIDEKSLRRAVQVRRT
jgi:Glutaredoxin-like domain (DUF836)